MNVFGSVVTLSDNTIEEMDLSRETSDLHHFFTIAA